MLASMMPNRAIMIAIVARSAPLTIQSMIRRIRTSRRSKWESAQRDHPLDDTLVDAFAVFRPKRLPRALPYFQFRGRGLVDFHFLVDQLLTELAFQFAIHFVGFFR